MIKAILFDIDGVLLDSRKANIKFFQDLLEKAGYKRPADKDVSRIFHMTMWDTIKLLSKEKSEEKIKKAWQLGCKMKYPMKLLRMPRHSKEAIKILKKSYKLGIVTSRIRRGIDRFFQFSKLRRYFDVTVSFEDYTKPKPNPESLLVALKKLKMNSDEAVYIGDSESDIKAAKAAKMKIIIYPKRLNGADSVLRNFKNLPSIVERLQKIPEIVKYFDKSLPHFADGRINYSKSNKAAVVTVFIKNKDEILLLKRSDEVRTYKNKWNTVAGYLDELKPIDEKALEELKEEIGLNPESITSLKTGKPFKIFDSKIRKTWFVHPILVKVKNKPKIRLDWEHSDYKWVKSKDLVKFDIVSNLSKSFAKASD